MMIGTRIGSRCFQQIDRFKLFAFLHVTKQHFSSGAAIFYRINGKLRDPDINCLFHPLSSSLFRVESAAPSLSIQHTFTTTYVRIINVVLRERFRRINSKFALWTVDGRMKNLNRVNFLLRQRRFPPKITSPTLGWGTSSRVSVVFSLERG